MTSFNLISSKKNLSFKIGLYLKQHNLFGTRDHFSTDGCSGMEGRDGRNRRSLPDAHLLGHGPVLGFGDP